jgi:integrase
MDLDTTAAPAGNEQRHGHRLVAWKLAQGSPHTLRAYGRSMTDFCSWLDGRGLDLLTVKRPVIDGYRHTLAGLSPATVAAKLAALSSFYRYAVSAGMIVGNPVELVRRPRVDPDHSSTEGLSKDQARALLAAAWADGVRSHALVSLLLFTGIRLSEALNAGTTDYGHDAGHRTLSIRRKGGKDGKVAVPAPAVEALNAYLGTTGCELAAGTGAVGCRSSRRPRAGAGIPLRHSVPCSGWRRPRGWRGGSVPTRCGIPLPPSPWTQGPPCTTSRTAWDMRTRAPRAGMTRHGARWRRSRATTWHGRWPSIDGGAGKGFPKVSEISV